MKIPKQLHLSPCRTATTSLQGRAWPKAAMIVVAMIAVVAGCSFVVRATPQAQDSEIPSEAQRVLFTKGQTLFAQGVYSEAINSFNEFLESYPNSSIKDLTVLWLGRSYLRTGDIANAEKMGRRLREIPASPYLDIYEDELRVARYGYAKSASPLITRDATRELAREVSRAGEGPTSPASKPAVPADKAAVRTTEVPTQISTVATNRPTDQNRSLPTVAPKITPLVKVEVPAKNETVHASPVAPSAAVFAPSVRLSIEEIPNTVPANGARFYRIVLRNEGKAAAMNLVVREELDESMNFASSDPAPARQEIVGQSLVLTYRPMSLAPGETKVIRLAVRPRPQATTRTATPIKHSASYSDAKGNTFKTQ
jgi:hypothetical protein